jgi:membrane fusion protein, multidrug efflux system
MKEAIRLLALLLFFDFACINQTALADSVVWNRAGENSVRGLVVSRQETTLSSQIAARIQRMNVEAGDRFNKGDVLVELDCQVLKAKRKKDSMKLEAEQLTHKANLRLQSFQSINDLDVAISAANVKEAQAQLVMSTVKSRMCLIKAPFSGGVIKRVANPFQSLSEGEAMLEIIDDNNLRLQLVIPSNWLRWIYPGMALTMAIEETGKHYSAHITTLGRKVDPASQTIEVWAELDSTHPGLLAGMSGQALFLPATP